MICKRNAKVYFPNRKIRTLDTIHTRKFVCLLKPSPPGMRIYTHIKNEFTISISESATQKKTRNSQSPSFNNRKYLYATYYFDNVSSFITRSVLTSTKYIIFHVTNLTMGKAGIVAFLIPSRRAYNFSVVRHQRDSYLGKAHLQKENNTKKDSKN